MELQQTQRMDTQQQIQTAQPLITYITVLKHQKNGIQTAVTAPA